ncbi:MAG TPA: hypothetical protein VFQ15_08650, partial [Jiangellaceae bacterium]|nr:hypothetical protein [Jiangellaceae bacterium]
MSTPLEAPMAIRRLAIRKDSSDNCASGHAVPSWCASQAALYLTVRVTSRTFGHHVQTGAPALLGFAGPKAEAEEIKRRLAAFLRDDLKLELSPDKTLITHAR